MSCPKKNKPATMARRLSVLAVNAALMLLASTAQAADGSKMFTIGGFGTVGATHSSIGAGDYTGDLYQPAGAGSSHSWTLGVDSKVAVQVDGQFSDQLTGVVQAVAMNRINNTFSPRIEWANLKYAITPDLSVRVGRIALPTYMSSTTRMVGYANPWIRPPIENYSVNPITNSDGIDGSFRHRFGSVNNTVQAWYGKTEVSVVLQDGSFFTGLKAKKIRGISDTVEYGALTARAGITTFDLEAILAPGMAPSDTVIKTVNLGAIYDPGSWFVQGELSRMESGVILRKVKSFYLTAGYRWNDFTPYVTYAQAKPDNDSRVGPVSRDQKTYSAGLRWDAMKNTAIKLQWDRVSLANGDYGFFTNARPGLAGSSGNVVSAAVDFVF